MPDLIKEINSLGIFGGMRKKEPLASLTRFLALADADHTQNDLIEAYSQFVNAVYSLRPDADFSGALWDCLKSDENAYINFTKTNAMRRRTGEKELKISKMMEVSVEKELEILTRIGNTSYINLQNMLYYDGYIPQFKTTGIDMKSRYMELLSSINS